MGHQHPSLEDCVWETSNGIFSLSVPWFCPAYLSTSYYPVKPKHSQNLFHWVFMNMTSIYSLTNGLLWNGEFFLGVQWASKKNQYLRRKKKGIHTNTDQTAIFTLPKKTQRTKIRKVRPGPSSQATQTTRGISYLTCWLSINRFHSNRGSVTPRRLGKGRRWEGCSRGRGHMYTYGWFVLIYGRNHHNIIT